MSDASFTIVAPAQPQPEVPTIQMISPNGGETLQAGDKYHIYWQASSTIQTVDIWLYQLNPDGTDRQRFQIADSIAAGFGSYLWTDIPANAVWAYNRIRVETTPGVAPRVYDDSDRNLAIVPPPQPEAPTVQVLSPNGGEILQAGSPYEINWTASETIQNVTITLSYCADATTQNYVVAAVTANDGVFIWDSIPTSVIGQFCRIAVSDAGGSGASDGSDSGFTIVAPAQPQPEVPTIQVISPNGGENIQVGSSYEINWVASSSITNVKIALSTNAGGTYTDIVSGEANDGAYIWMVDTQQLTSKFCRIRISDADPTNSTASDASDMSFTIASQAEVPPEDDTIQVVSPNGGETWRAGDPCEINWIASDSITRVNIELTYFAGGSMNTHAITQAVDNTGVYIWPSIPGSVVGNFCRITVSDAGTSGAADTSDASFTIGASAQPQPEVPTIQVISPNGGETWQSGQARDVTWQASTSIQEVKIELTYFAQNEVKTHTIAAETPNVGTYTWQPIPLDAIGKFCRIRISDADPNTSISDESDASFTINEGPIIQITSPNGGEVWERGTDREITWNASSSIQDVVISLYQLNPDGTVLKWITITPSVAANTGRYLWTDIPAGAIGMRNRILIDTLAGVVPRITDISDHNFTIQEDCITLGCVLNRILASSSDDSDNDSIPDDVEAMLGSDPNDHDSDHDGVFDYTELFQNWSFDDHESIPDADGDNLIAALDADDNGDGIPDSQQVDSDSDGITNSLELYGYTYDWGTGQYAAWDGDQSVDYYKSDPYQKSSDQDPFDDNVEVSGLGMDVTVDEPGSLPMVPAFPDIAVRLEGYAVALNKEITWSQGESLGEGSEWSRSVEASHSHTSESNWETGVEVGMKFEFESIIPSFECEVKTHQNWGGSSSQTNSTTTAHSTGGSILSEKNWSKATTTNPTDAAHMKLFLKVYNNGTAVASNIIPTFTLKIGGHNIATFEQGNAQINLLEPGGVYPASPGVYWVVDSIDTGAGVAPISLTLDELKALESGAPVSITVTQALADVMQRNLQTGVYESVGDWGEYKARIEAVSALVFADLGDGNYIRSHVYADDGPTAPVVTVGDALLWATGGYFDPDGNLVVRYRDYRTGWVEERTIAQEGLGNTWTLALDSRTYEANGLTWDETTGVWDPPVTEPQNLRLNPDSLLILKAPSEEVFGGGEPSIHSAYFDRSVGAVFVSADDYTGVKTVAFIDKNSNSTDMYEWVQGASFYVYYPVDYDFDGTETVCATNMNDAQTCSEITGVYLAETPPPVIDSVVYDRSNPGEVKNNRGGRVAG